ncbi:MAG TPA: AraC family transcriptional regulator [Candidatus Blautia ornithocaccae]|nr:AraC family transcriptional regulator [Candidatus Blautia ornithocaccae]
MEKKSTSRQASLTVYFCGKEECQPGHYFGPAVRPHYLIHVILEGKGIFQKSGVTYSLKKGDAFLIPPMESTYYQADKENPWSYAWVGFDGSACPEILSQTVFSDSFIYQNPGSNISALLACMERLLASFRESHGRQLEPMGNLLMLLSFMQNPSPEKSRDFSDEYFKAAREYIDHNYSYDIRISDVARHVGIDRTYLYKIFMEHGKTSPKQYLLWHRLRMAVQMLCSTDYTITEIALSCGFKDAPSFCNYFKKHIGFTPRAFRKEFQDQGKTIPVNNKLL